MTNVNTWAVQPASWSKFDEHGAVYCADIDTAYKVANDQLRFGDQMIYRINNNTTPIKWVRVYKDDGVQAVTDQQLSHLV